MQRGSRTKKNTQSMNTNPAGETRQVSSKNQPTFPCLTGHTNLLIYAALCEASGDFLPDKPITIGDMLMTRTSKKRRTLNLRPPPMQTY